MTDSQPVQVSLRVHSKGPLLAFPCEGKLILTLWSNVNGEKGIC